MKHTWTYPNCRVDRVIDGDTFVAVVDVGFDLSLTREVRVRGINCPERHGSTKVAGEAAKMATEKLLALGAVTIRSARWDKYRRIEADVVLADERDLGDTLIELGHAVKMARLDDTGEWKVPPEIMVGGGG